VTKKRKVFKERWRDVLIFTMTLADVVASALRGGHVSRRTFNSAAVSSGLVLAVSSLAARAEVFGPSYFMEEEFEDEKIIVEFELWDGMLIADSISIEHTFKAKEKVTVRMSNKPLYSVSF